MADGRHPGLAVIAIDLLDPVDGPAARKFCLDTILEVHGHGYRQSGTPIWTVWPPASMAITWMREARCWNTPRALSFDGDAEATVHLDKTLD
ncbi:MAG: hypothetical protein AAFO29_11055 [Actinomycetota bacterium]